MFHSLILVFAIKLFLDSVHKIIDLAYRHEADKHPQKEEEPEVVQRAHHRQENAVEQNEWIELREVWIDVLFGSEEEDDDLDE